MKGGLAGVVSRKVSRDAVKTATSQTAIMASASIEPPVWPTLTPRLAIKLSIF